MIYAEAVYFERAQFAHIVAYEDAWRLAIAAKRAAQHVERRRRPRR